MAKLTLLCGKICSGKTTYAQQLKREKNAVVLSVDTLMRQLFEECQGEVKHRENEALVKKYLWSMAEEILFTGTNVILDWGFWTKDERESAHAHCMEWDLPYEFRYVKVSDKQWEMNIDARNSAIEVGILNEYYIDDKMKYIQGGRFEEPKDSEMDVIYTYEE